MFKCIKLPNGLIYQNVNLDSLPQDFIPTDLDGWKAVASETVRWLAGQKIFAHMDNDPTKRDTALTKAIVLLVKAITNLISQNDLTFDTTNFTANETTIWTNLVQLMSDGYSDSPLTVDCTNSILDSLKWYNDQLTTIDGLTTIEDVQDYLANLTY